MRSRISTLKRPVLALAAVAVLGFAASSAVASDFCSPCVKPIVYTTVYEVQPVVAQTPLYCDVCASPALARTNLPGWYSDDYNYTVSSTNTGITYAIPTQNGFIERDHIPLTNAVDEYYATHQVVGGQVVDTSAGAMASASTQLEMDRLDDTMKTAQAQMDEAFRRMDTAQLQMSRANDTMRSAQSQMSKTSQDLQTAQASQSTQDRMIQANQMAQSARTQANQFIQAAQEQMTQTRQQLLATRQELDKTTQDYQVAKKTLDESVQDIDVAWGDIRQHENLVDVPPLASSLTTSQTSSATAANR